MKKDNFTEKKSIWRNKSKTQKIGFRKRCSLTRVNLFVYKSKFYIRDLTKLEKRT